MLTEKYKSTTILVTYKGGILDGRTIKMGNKSTTVTHSYKTLNSIYNYDFDSVTNTFNLTSITRK